MNITRIKPPKYKVGKYTLNEYEARCLMAEVSQGKREPGIKIKDSDGRVAEILPDGRLSNNLKGFDICSNFTLTILKEQRLKEIEKQKERKKQEIIPTHFDKSTKQYVKVDLSSLMNRFEYGLQADMGESYLAVVTDGEKTGEKILVYPKHIEEIEVK